MPIQSSFPKVADQVISFNKNLVDILSKLNNLTTTTESTVNVQIYDEEGVLRNFSLPSFTSLKSEIDRLNNNINSLYSIDAGGSLIQTTSANQFKKIITVDLNRDPLPVDTIGTISSFKSKVNWFFDSMIDPMMQVEVDLSNKVEANVSKCLVRRYIINFEQDEDGLTTNGESALNSFNELFRGNSNIIFSEFEEWHSSTPGVVEPLNPRYDEDTYELEPNNTLYDGEFSVLRIQEDRLNRKLWYVLNTLEYVVAETTEVLELSIGSELIVNSEKTSTRYKVIEVSTVESNPRIRLERLEGIEPIPVGVGTLKIYSPIIYNKKVRINIGYAERNIIFLKPINTENNLVAKKWSNGSGFYSNDLRLSSSTDDNGLTMEQFYTQYVYDYGEVLKDLVSKKIPNRLAGIPSAPSLDVNNFKVVQINKHLTDTPNSNLIKQKHNYQNTIKSEIRQIEEAIVDRNKKVKVTKFASASAVKQSALEVNELVSKKESRSKLLSTVTQEIIDLSKAPITKAEPKFKVRGFWEFPDAVVTKGSLPQEVIQFRVQYRYVSVDGSETSIEQYSVNNQEKASFSNWNEFKSDVRKRVFDSETGEYFWEIEDLENADTPNINQIDVSIQSGERVEFRIKSISEVGWPDSIVESAWSEIISIDFPNDLDGVLNENEFILQEANKEDVRLTLNSELQAKGLDEHLSSTVIDDSRTFHHEASKILSGFKGEDGAALDLFEYLRSLENRIVSLQERIERSKGELEVILVGNGSQYVIKNGNNRVISIDCADYADNYLGGPDVFENKIYSIKDYVLRISNVASSSPLGLLSDKTYLQNSNVYDTDEPQVFFVNEEDELLKSDVTSQTRTQLNNQFIWSVNYDGNTKLSENIGNKFIQDNNNSIVDVLSQKDYNIGYNENNILSFVGNNNSILDSSKWTSDTDKGLLTTIHPVVKDLESIVENNSDQFKTVNPGVENEIIIPLNIYFKLNSLDTNQSGVNYEYVPLNKITTTHIKKLKFLLENESENRPFTFTIEFRMKKRKKNEKATKRPILVEAVKQPATTNNIRFTRVDDPFDNTRNQRPYFDIFGRWNNNGFGTGWNSGWPF